MARQTILTDPKVTCPDRVLFGDTGTNVTIQPGMTGKLGYNSTAQRVVLNRTNATTDKNLPVVIVTEDAANNVLTQGNYTTSQVEREFNGASAAANIVADADSVTYAFIKDINHSLARIAGGQTVAPRAMLAFDSTNLGLLVVTTAVANAVAQYAGSTTLTTAANTPELAEVDWA